MRHALRGRMAMRHEQLIVWQRADDLFIRLHNLARKSFPPDERFELGSQIRRAAYSVVANIVEGMAREHRAERSQFLNIAWGSLAEVTASMRHGAWGTSISGDTKVLNWKFGRLAPL